MRKCKIVEEDEEEEEEVANKNCVKCHLELRKCGPFCFKSRLLKKSF